MTRERLIELYREFAAVMTDTPSSMKRAVNQLMECAGGDVEMLNAAGLLELLHVGFGWDIPHTKRIIYIYEQGYIDWANRVLAEMKGGA